MFRKKYDTYMKATILGMLEIQKLMNRNQIELLNRIEKLEEENFANKIEFEMEFLSEEYNCDVEVIDCTNKIVVYCNGTAILEEESYKSLYSFIENNSDEIEIKIKSILFDELKEKELEKSIKNGKKKSK